MSTVIERIESILTSEYSVQNYVEFVREVFAGMELVAPDRPRKEFSNFSSHIASSSHIGNYTFPDGKKLIVFAVQLLNKTYVEGSRSTQRSYAKKLIENANADAAFIAFYTEGDPKWRLSFVRLDYEMKFENGKLKTAENMTPAKRYSYLVGQDEPCHTAIDRFRKFITDAVDKQEHPTLDELEEAFSVEAVTNEFFALYCEKFHQLREHLEKSEDFLIEAEQHNFTSAQFAKKLMGQIVFLYFLQKKGWLGVGAWPNTLTEKEYKNAFFAKGSKSRQLIPLIYQMGSDGLYHVSARGLNSLSDEDETVLAQCVNGRPWGTGPHNFMRRLFEFSKKKNANFYDDYLEPLFYNALNVNRGEQGYDPVLHCRIPFLSGGLFEPLDGYEWEHNNFAIPNEVFSNRQGNNARTGDGILDIFDRYNFTMSEDEPLEREVAIDPEMLGKVFENLLEVNDRKSKGAFYTPREIVHYMCQESLVLYLTSSLQVSEEAVRDFILYGDFMKDEDTVKEKRQGNGGMFISEELYKIDSDGKVIVNRLTDMDSALANVRVADPAVGSGAFPLGMLNEIVRARQNISAYYAITMNPYDARMMYQLERSSHNLKYETIRNCIFAADIEPSAVDIAQLRLWLSLVIDDEINPDAQGPLDGHRNPLPLPNLECNILCGNSLLDCFEGIPLINQSELIGTSHVGQQTNLFQTSFDAVLPQLIEAQNRLFRCDDTLKKKELLQEISELREIVIESQLQGRLSADARKRYEESKNAASKQYVLWQLDFARVFKEKGGFDIVIGNPPYGAKISASEKKQYTNIYECTKTIKGKQKGSTDTFALFIEKGLTLLKTNPATLAYIVPMSLTSSDSMTALHKIIERQCASLKISSYSNRPKQIFDAACVRTSIVICQKTGTPLEHLFTTKLVRRSETNTIENIIKSLEFVDSLDLKISGRYPKLGSANEYGIIKQLYASRCSVADFVVENSPNFIYYRSSGGRYFNVITPYSTGSSKEVALPVDSDYQMMIGAILSTSIFWMWQQVYTNGLDIKQSEIRGFPLPDLKSVPQKTKEELGETYSQYLDDIEKNVLTHESKTYVVNTFKEYKLVKSTDWIFKMDDIAGKIYGLTDKQIDFIKKYEATVRINE